MTLFHITPYCIHAMLLFLCYSLLAYATSYVIVKHSAVCHSMVHSIRLCYFILRMIACYTIVYYTSVQTCNTESYVTYRIAYTQLHVMFEHTIMH